MVISTDAVRTADPPLEDEHSWPDRTVDVLRAADVTRVAYVPDAGHTRTINLFAEDPNVISTVLTTEEEGVALAAGAWLAGQRSVLLMQSSGVGNCINMLSLPVIMRMPFLTLVTMRGEWHEFNPWQMPMGHAVEESLRGIGVSVVRAATADDLVAIVESSAHMAFEANEQIAVLIDQRLLGAKRW